MKKTFVFLLIFACLILGNIQAELIYNDLEDIGEDNSIVSSVTFANNITVTISASNTYNVIAATYNDADAYVFAGVTGYNVPKNPSNVSYSRFISAQGDITAASPIVFTFSAAVKSFGLTTIDALETSGTITLELFDAENNSLGVHTRSGDQGSSGLDLDWFVTSSNNAEDVVKAVLTANIGSANGHGIDDLVIESSVIDALSMIPEPASIILLGLTFLFCLFRHKKIL